MGGTSIWLVHYNVDQRNVLNEYYYSNVLIWRIQGEGAGGAQIISLSIWPSATKVFVACCVQKLTSVVYSSVHQSKLLPCSCVSIALRSLKGYNG